MKYFSMYAKSLSTKLVLAFILVAVPPMLVASDVASTMISDAANRNIERWLHNAATYVFSSLKDTEAELSAVSVLFLSRFTSAQITFTPDELEAFSDLDTDFILLKEASGAVLFSNAPVETVGEALYPGSFFRWVTLNDQSRHLAIVVSHPLQASDGTERVLELGCWFTIQLSENSVDAPLGIRIFLPEAEDFVQVYSSLVNEPFVIPSTALQAIRAGCKDVFIPDADWTDNTPNAHVWLKPLKNAAGDILALFVISVHLLPVGDWTFNTTFLFWGFFIFGTALSGCTGYFLAQRLVRPVKRLNEGVKSIAAGDLACRVNVSGHDEVTELSAGFNLMAQQLERMRHESIQNARRERARMLGEIALGFAHEIRNPLVVIKTSAELVHNKLPDNAKESRLLGLVIEEVGRIDSLITQFLSFAKPAPLKLEYFVLHELIEDVLELCAAEFARHGIDCTLCDDATTTQILGECNQIRQALLNLVLNAVDAMPEGGTLRVRLYDHESEPRLCLEIRDTGMGIPEELLPTIYLPFISTKKNGLGLGLSQVYALVEEHDGTITCSSKPGEGTIFTVCLNK